MTDWRDSKYLAFAWAGTSESGRTERWAVTSTSSGDRLGTVSWYGPWRQYVFEPMPDCVFNDGCLADITGFLSEVNAARRAGRRPVVRREPA